MEPASIISIVMLAIMAPAVTHLLHWLGKRDNEDAEAKQLVRIGILEHDTDMLLPCSNPACLECFPAATIMVKKISEPSVAEIIRDARKVSDEIAAKHAILKAQLQKEDIRITEINEEFLRGGMMTQAEIRAKELGVRVSKQHDYKMGMDRYALSRGDRFVTFNVLNEEARNDVFIAETRMLENLDIIISDQYPKPVRAIAPRIPTKTIRGTHGGGPR